MTDVVLPDNVSNQVMKTSCWNFDIASRTLQCFSEAVGLGGSAGSNLSAPKVSPYFDAGINFYIKSQYLWMKYAQGNSGNMLTNEWDNSGSDGNILGLLKGLENVDCTVISAVKGGDSSCQSMGNATWMVNDTSPYAMICTFVRYHDPTNSYYGDFPVILIYADGSSKGGGSGPCFQGNGYLMFTPNTPDDGNAGGVMTLVDLATAVAAGVQFSIVSNSSTPQTTATPVLPGSIFGAEVNFTGQQVIINYMDKTRVWPQPVSMIPTTPNWAGPGEDWSAAWTTAGPIKPHALWGYPGNAPDGGPLYDPYEENTGMRFGLFNSQGTDVGYNRSLIYSLPDDDNELWFPATDANSYSLGTMTLPSPLTDGLPVSEGVYGPGFFSTILFQLVVSPWYKRSADTYFPPAAGLAADPSGFHIFMNSSALYCTMTCTFAPNPTQIVTDTTTYAPQYTYTLNSSFIKEVAAVPTLHRAPTTHAQVWYKIVSDSNLPSPNGAITITDTQTNAISYGEPLGICQSRRLEGDAILSSFWTHNSASPFLITEANYFVDSYLCFNTLETYRYQSVYISPTDPCAGWGGCAAAVNQTTHYISDLNLRLYNNVGVSVTFSCSSVYLDLLGIPHSATTISGDTTSFYEIPVATSISTPDYSSIMQFKLDDITYSFGVSLSPVDGSPVFNMQTGVPFVLTLTGDNFRPPNTTSVPNWTYTASLTTKSFVPLDLTAAFTDFDYLQSGMTLQVTGLPIMVVSGSGTNTYAPAGVLSKGGTYYIDFNTLPQLKVTYADSSGNPICTFTFEALGAPLQNGSSFQMFTNRLRVVQTGSTGSGYALAVKFQTIRNGTTENMWVSVPNPWNSSTPVQKMPFNAGASMMVAAADLSALQLVFS